MNIRIPGITGDERLQSFLMQGESETRVKWTQSEGRVAVDSPLIGRGIWAERGFETQAVLPMSYRRGKVWSKVLCKGYFFLTALIRICSVPTKIPCTEIGL